MLLCIVLVIQVMSRHFAFRRLACHESIGSILELDDLTLEGLALLVLLLLIPLLLVLLLLLLLLRVRLQLRRRVLWPVLGSQARG